jgi:hypothetical protein
LVVRRRFLGNLVVVGVFDIVIYIQTLIDSMAMTSSLTGEFIISCTLSVTVV